MIFNAHVSSIVEQVKKHHVHEVRAFQDGPGVEGKGYCDESGVLEVAHLREQSRFNAQLFNETRAWNNSFACFAEEVENEIKKRLLEHS